MLYFNYAEVAQLVEHRTENPGVGSSILPLGIKGRCGSGVEQRFRKPQVEGSSPSTGLFFSASSANSVVARMDKLIFSISGARGIVGESLTPEVASNFGKAFGTFIVSGKGDRDNPRPYIDKKIVVGRDARESGEWLKEAFISGVLSTGSSVIDVGPSPTPTVLFNIRPLNANGGAVITASHNPPEWNGFKFANEKGIFLNAQEMSELYKIYKNKKFVTNRKGNLVYDNKSKERHTRAVLDSLDSKLIQSKHFKVILDSTQGVVSEECAILLRQLGCKFWEENSTRGLEPTRENLSNLTRTVKSKGADVGFATDPDGDRLSLVAEDGEALGEEYTLPLVASWILIKNQKLKIKNQKLVVTNLSTSKMIEDVVTQNGGKTIRTPVGEVNVVKEMMRKKAVLGGEGNGGIIDPTANYTRDSLVGIGRILEYMATSGEKLSTLANYLPKYYMIKEKVACSRKFVGTRYSVSLLELLPKIVEDNSYRVNREDGVRIDFSLGWIHIRKSNTEPILRIICETTDKKLTDSLLKEVKINLTGIEREFKR